MPSSGGFVDPVRSLAVGAGIARAADLGAARASSLVEYDTVQPGGALIGVTRYGANSVLRWLSTPAVVEITAVSPTVGKMSMKSTLVAVGVAGVLQAQLTTPSPPPGRVWAARPQPAASRRQLGVGAEDAAVEIAGHALLSSRTRRSGSR